MVSANKYYYPRDKIVHLAANPGMMETMGIAVRKKADHGSEAHYQGLVAVYKKALE